MNTLMQREDFLALCKPKRRRMGPAANALRLIDDWLPKGTTFMFNGLLYESFGPHPKTVRGRYTMMLEARSLFRGQDVQEVVHLSTNSLLSLVQQNSVDHINALNFFDQ